jgi:hypothetical protein
MYSLWIALNKYIAELMGLQDFEEEEDEELGHTVYATQLDPDYQRRPLDVHRRQTI